MDTLRGKLHHVEIYVSDLNRSKEFWGWLLGELGYEKFQEWAAGISYKLGDTYLVFVQVEDAYLGEPYHRKRAGLNHLAFYAESESMVDQFAEKLREKGITLLYHDKYPYAGGENYYAVFFEDPDRIKVEIVAPAGR